MAINPQRLQNFGVRGVKLPALRLSDDPHTTTTDYAEILVGDGVPSGGYGRDAGATLIYIRKDATSADAAVYISVNGGTDWSPAQTTGAGGAQADLIFSAATELTIAAGAVTATQGAHTIDTEADAASDDLDTIAGGTAEELILVRPASAAHTVVLKHAIGANRIACPGGRDISLAEATDWALLGYDGTQWVCIAFSTLALGGGGLGSALASVANGLGASLIGIEDAGGLITATTVEGALAENRTAIDALEVQTAALGAENTDGQLQIPLLAGVADGGTWTLACSSAGLVTATRTAADAPDSLWVEIPILARSTASKGIKPTGLRVNYSVATADVADVRFEVWKVTQGADNAARTAAVLFGEDDADYDGAHNTAAERGDDTTAPELHLAVVTDAGTPAYLGSGESLLLRCYVDGDAGGAGVVVVTSAILLYSETRVDLA